MASETCGGSSGRQGRPWIGADDAFREDNPQLQDLWHTMNRSMEGWEPENPPSVGKTVRFLAGIGIKCDSYKQWEKDYTEWRDAARAFIIAKREYDITYKLLFDPQNPPVGRQASGTWDCSG